MTTLDEEQFVDVKDADAVAAAARSLTEDADPSAPPALPASTDGPVKLPGGFRRVLTSDTGAPQLVDVSTAWIKELNGEDEERIAKAQRRNDAVAYIDAILEAGVERLGDQKPTSEDFKSLLVGDRDFLLLEISRATYGDELEYEEFPCPFCRVKIDFTVSKGEDIPVDRLDSVEEQFFTFETKKGNTYDVHLPTGVEQARAFELDTQAAYNTQILASCVFDGDETKAKSLGIAERREIVAEIGKRMPGPRYNEITFEHPECGNEINLEVPIGDLFPGLGA